MESKTIRKYAKKLFANQEYSFDIPLVIDELSVILYVDLKRGFRIESDDVDRILYEKEDSMDDITVESIYYKIQEILDILENLCYSKLMGKLMLRHDTELLKYKVFKKFIKKDHCSICWDETTVHTICNHYCCHKCMEKIDICPICRKSLFE